MKCNGEFIFKTISKRDSGDFKSSDGKVYSYDACYVVKVDEITDDIRERKFYFPIKEKSLYDDFSVLESYTKISIGFDVLVHDNYCKLIPNSVSII